MYVLENVRDFVQLHNLQAGSTLSFYYAPDNRLVGHLQHSLLPARFKDRQISCPGVEGVAVSRRALSGEVFAFATARVLCF